MNIFDELKKEHRVQRDLMTKILETHGESKRRIQLFGELKQSLQAHAKAEERYFYKRLIDFDETQEEARHSIAEHKELDDFIEELEDTDMSSNAWLMTFKHLAERLHHHLDEEEEEFFPTAEDVLSESEQQKLGRSYRESIEEDTSSSPATAA